MEESEGEYVVFLDADDRLMREGVEEGVRSLEAHPECAFVYGRYKTITAEGLPLSTGPRHREDKDQYMALLRRNFIGMHATVMYRRGVLELTGGFDTTLAACEDYDLYLRIARNYPVCSHDSIVAEYRQHDSNMSGDAELMLKTSLNALRLQRGYLKSDRRLEQAYRDGIAYWKNYYGALLARRVQAQAQSRDWALALGGALVLLRHSPRELARLAVAEGKQKAARAPRKLLARLFRYRRSES